ncbi:MAG: potassium channel protein [Oceanospirillaceae bacterium]|nr:potassium channel protein [Oceanospirillaceae bacterium]
MTSFDKIRKVLVKYFIDLRWQSIFIAIAIYFAASWLLLALCGETDITSGSNFLYWIMVTASTVGYGDFSPTTAAGKLVTALFVIPLGLSIFGLVIGRIATFVSHHWRKGVLGLKPLNYQDHLLIIGWNGARTMQLIRLLLQETQQSNPEQKIALCVSADIENPMPDKIGFVRVNSFSNLEDMQRASISEASCIIIDNPEDDVTMTTALFCAQQNPTAHTIAYFKDEHLGSLLKSHCPNIECMPSVAVEMLAKSAMDPGSSALHQQLLDSNRGMTQYSITYKGAKNTAFEALFHTFKHQYQSTLIGVCEKGQENIELNPSLDKEITPGSRLFYIAAKRIKNIDWS